MAKEGAAVEAAVKLIHHPQFGTVAVAGAAFQPGAAVLSEAPLVVALPPDDPLLMRCFQAVGAHAEGLELENGTSMPPQAVLQRLARFLAWCLAPPALQQQVLRDMCSSPGPGLEDSDEVLRCQLAAELIVTHVVPRLPSLLPRGRLVPPPCTAGTVTQVLLAWAMNSHSFGDDRCVRRVCGAGGAVHKPKF